MKTTLPSEQNIPQHTNFSLQEGLTFRVPQVVMETENPFFAPYHSKVECTRTNVVFSSLSEVSTGAVDLWKIIYSTFLLFCRSYSLYLLFFSSLYGFLLMPLSIFLLSFLFPFFLFSFPYFPLILLSYIPYPPKNVCTFIRFLLFYSSNPPSLPYNVDSSYNLIASNKTQFLNLKTSRSLQCS